MTERMQGKGDFEGVPYPAYVPPVITENKKRGGMKNDSERVFRMGWV